MSHNAIVSRRNPYVISHNPYVSGHNAIASPVIAYALCCIAAEGRENPAHTSISFKF